MKFCDITIAYNENSGGIRTYIDQKINYLLNETSHDHLLIIPGPEDSVVQNGRSTQVTIESPLLPSQDDYRFFLRPDKIVDALKIYLPDIVELASYYVAPWSVFSYRKHLLKNNKNCIIGCYFHSDVANAYVSAPIRALTHDWFSNFSDTLTELGEKLADIAESKVENYIGSIFKNCDISLASSSIQANRLKEHGVSDIKVIPLGVDTETFHPHRRSNELRSVYGASVDNIVLTYAGRLSYEKHLDTIINAFLQLPSELNALLWFIGEGPQHEEIEALTKHIHSFRLIPFQKSKLDLACLLASADIYVTAGAHETFGLSVIEAQACGLPVVGVEAGALRERVPIDLGYLGPVNDIESMSNNIQLAARHRRIISSKARDYVIQKFSWAASFSKLVEIYLTECKHHV